MEREQRLAIFKFKDLMELAYEDRHHRLNIYSLERRRLHGDHILAYNMFHSLLDLPQT